MTFLQRVQNYLQLTVLRLLVVPSLMAPINNFVKEEGLDYPPYQSGWHYSSASIVIGDWALEFPYPLPPNVHMVGPILAEDAKPLPADINAVLDEALTSGHPAVYVSMGTLAMPSEEELLSMVRGLSALPNPVLWKLDSQMLPGNTTLLSLQLGSNIKIIKWAPQNDILGHPAVGVFLTQGGINSLYEAAYRAKPIVTIPLIADQEGNAVTAEYHGFGVTTKPSKLTAMNGRVLADAIQHVLNTPSFKNNAQKVSKRLRNRPRHPAQPAADVVERVIATGGEHYLETHQHRLTWWQLSLLDAEQKDAVQSCGQALTRATYCQIAYNSDSLESHDGDYAVPPRS
ncbi:TPA: hypothetical protein ACH3X3_009010 [Trebouxia sp. C0006]